MPLPQPQKSTALAHALIFQFLELNKYHKTLDTLREETSEKLTEGDYGGLNGRRGPRSATLFQQPPETTLMRLVEEHLMAGVQEEFEEMNLNRQMDQVLLNTTSTRTPLSSTPLHLHSTFSQLHTGNILAVRVQNLPALQSPFTNSSFTQIIPTLITSSSDKLIKLTSLLFKTTLNTLKIHQSPVLCFDFHPIFKMLMASGSMDSTVILANVVTNEVLQRFNDHGKYVVHLGFSPDGKFFASASHDHTVNFYEVIESSTESTRAQSPFECQISPSFLPQNTLPADLKYTKIHTQIFTGNIESFCFLPDNRHLVVGIREDNYLHYIKYNPYSPSSSINPSSSFTTTKYNMNSTGDDWISFTPMHISPSPHNNGSYLLVSTDSSSQNGRLILFKTHSSKQLRNFYGIEVDRFSTPKHCWHPSGAYFYAGEDTGDICVFGVAEGKILKRLKGHHGAIKGLWFDWERNFLVSCSLDRTICVWGHECGG